MKISASDRSALIKLASELPVGSEERRAILAGLSKVGDLDLNELKQELQKKFRSEISSVQNGPRGSHSIFVYLYSDLSNTMLKALVDTLEKMGYTVDESKARGPAPSHLTLKSGV